MSYSYLPMLRSQKALLNTLIGGISRITEGGHMLDPMPFGPGSGGHLKPPEAKLIIVFF